MDENNLIILLQQGDQDAYKQLFIKYYSPLCEYASQYISDDDSEEPARNLSGNICYEPIRGKYECANCPKTRSIGKNRRIQDIAGT